MQVKIIKFSHGAGSWYYDKIGKTVSVTDPKGWKGFYQLEGKAIGHLISKNDAKLITIKQTPMTRIRLALHNIIGHPIMEVCYIFGLRRIGNFIHDKVFKV